MAVRSQATVKLTIRLSPAEVKALDALAKRLGTTREEALRKAFLRELQVAHAGEYERFSEQEIARLVEIGPATNAKAADLRRDVPDDDSSRRPDRTHVGESEKPEVPLDAAELERRARLVEAMLGLRERIRARTGNIPDIKELIDEGRDI